MNLERDAEFFLDKKLNHSRSIFSPSFIKIHSKCVKEMALKLAFLRVLVNHKVIKVASWLHDIGRVENDENHKIIGVDIAEEWFKSINFKKKRFIKKVNDCILYHGREDIPKTKEGKIIRIADKLSFIHPQMLEYAQQKNGISEVKEYIKTAQDIDRLSLRAKILRWVYIKRAKTKYHTNDT